MEKVCPINLGFYEISKWVIWDLNRFQFNDSDWWATAKYPHCFGKNIFQMHTSTSDIIIIIIHKRRLTLNIQIPN